MVPKNTPGGKPRRFMVVTLMAATVLLAGLACSNSQTAGSVTPRIMRLATLTPTVDAARPNPNPLNPANAAAITSTLGANVPEVVAQSQDWAFTNLRSAAADGQNLHLWGELLNNTSQAQNINAISGTFYNEQAQVIAGPDSVSGLWPVTLVQPGDRLPFMLIVTGIQSAANMELSATADPVAATVRQDFQFNGLQPSVQAGDYCVTGTMQNPGSELQEFLIIALVLYDSQDNVLNFGSYNELYFAGITGQQLLDFEICAPPPNQNVARFQVRGWGQ